MTSRKLSRKQSAESYDADTPTSGRKNANCYEKGTDSPYSFRSVGNPRLLSRRPGRGRQAHECNADALAISGIGTSTRTSSQFDNRRPPCRLTSLGKRSDAKSQLGTRRYSAVNRWQCCVAG